MKIDILGEPPVDLFKNRRAYIIVFVVLLALACFGVFLGVVSVLAQTSHYELFEKLALVFFVAPSPFAFYVGEKLQRYKRLNLPQQEKLTALAQQYPEVKVYCDRVAKLNRGPVLAEYRACKAWVEDVKMQSEVESENS